MSLGTTLPARYYTDPAVYEIERHTIFARAWNLVAYEHQLRNPGDYVTENLAGWPIFVRRNPDGTLAGFVNVCPHRAGPIVEEGAGCQANLVCRYHGWAFANDGALINARDFGGTIDEPVHLSAVRAESWRGMVFVCFDPAAPPLVEWLGGFPAHCAQYPLESYRFYWRSTRTLHMNWKNYADNYNEGYHLPTVHAPTLARAVDALEYRVTTGEQRHWNLHRAPQRDGTDWSGIWGYVWPTFSFNIFDNGMAIERWLPRGHDTSELIFEYFFAEGAEGIEALVKESEVVADEDALICVHVQRAMESGVYDVGVLSPRHEHYLATFTEMVREAVDPYLPDATGGSRPMPLGLPVMRLHG